jgi:hypothetical protein
VVVGGCDRAVGVGVGVGVKLHTSAGGNAGRRLPPRGNNIELNGQF